MPPPWTRSLAGIAALLAASCGSGMADNPPAAPQTEAVMPTDPAAATPSKGPRDLPPPIAVEALTYDRVADPVERSFAIDLPGGWRNEAFLVRSYTLVKPVSTTSSPDGSTAAFSGDASLTFFTKPGQLDRFLEAQIVKNPLMKLGHYVPADRFLSDYVRRRFGVLEGFTIDAAAESPLMAEAIQAAMQRTGNQVRFTTAHITPHHTADRRRVNAAVHGATVDAGLVWFPDVAGVVSTSEPGRFDAMLRHVVLSHRTDPAWQRREQAAHEQRMAQLRQDYANQQVAFRAMNQQHAARMQQMTASHDAHNRQWASQQASSDAGHERFLIQVDNSHAKYFVNSTTNTCVGTDSTTSLDDLRNLGLNPDDFREARTIR